MKILILHPHGGMGDLLLSFPVVQAFAGQYPKAEIVYVAPVGLEIVLENHPLISRVISIKPDLKGAFDFIKWCRNEKIDLACALWTTGRIALILKLSGIPIRIGQAGRFFYSFLFTHQVKVRSAEGDRMSHWVECLLDYPRSIGIEAKDKSIKIEVSEEAIEHAKGLLKKIGVMAPFIILHCGKGENLQGRGWPMQKFAEIADELTKLGYSVVFTGNQKETPMIENILKFMKEKGYSVAGKTDFATLAVLLKLSKLVLCPDSGPMHLAAAVGTPVVALFLMEKDFPERWRPWEVTHRIIRPETFPCKSWCTKENCPDFKCFQVMPTERILTAALELLKQSL